MTAKERALAFRAGRVEIKDGIAIFENGDRSSLHSDIFDNIYIFEGLGHLYYSTDDQKWVISREDETNYYHVPLMEESYEGGKKWWQILIPVYREYLYEKGRENGKYMVREEELVEATKHGAGYRFSLDDLIEFDSLRPFELGVEKPEYFINNTSREDEVCIPIENVVSAEITSESIEVKYFDEDDYEIKSMEVRILTTVSVNPLTRK